MYALTISDTATGNSMRLPCTDNRSFALAAGHNLSTMLRDGVRVTVDAADGEIGVIEADGTLRRTRDGAAIDYAAYMEG